jgi:hypothetical protein
MACLCVGLSTNRIYKRYVWDNVTAEQHVLPVMTAIIAVERGVYVAGSSAVEVFRIIGCLKCLSPGFFQCPGCDVGRWLFPVFCGHRRVYVGRAQRVHPVNRPKELRTNQWYFDVHSVEFHGRQSM